ncbi:mitochondrial ribosomal protein L49 [Brienomyrus brachyistius]|uniref:mitochondrial ribosomal protein L49 n=1 Tax=Brienomyrus brachyistius TaxID=42636 RepID=UPI0020B2C9E7|nr:mitochondrial ribosomal protein L49 [Brienomyrus brachyistius]
MSASVVNMLTRMCAAIKPTYVWLTPVGVVPSKMGRLRMASSCTGEQKSSVVESTEEYRYVERLIPPTQIPAPPLHDGPAPSGWRPPSAVTPDLPYMVRRSRMHNVPVYTDLTHGNRKTTLLRKIEGDIWALEKDVKEYLVQLTGKSPLTQVNEVTMSIRIKGHFDRELKEWLLEKGF